MNLALSMHPRVAHDMPSAKGLVTLTSRSRASTYGAPACHSTFLEQPMNTKFLIPLCAAAALLAACGQRDNSPATGSDAANSPGATTGETGAIDNPTNESAGDAGATPGATTAPDTATTPGTTSPDGTTTPDTTSAPDDNRPSQNQPTTSPGG
jgi:hypothetical protein